VSAGELLYRVLLLAVSAGWWLPMWLSGRLRALAGLDDSRCVALYYHTVRQTDRARFAWQMDELLRLARPVAADAAEFPADDRRPCAMVTFDDGFRCVVRNALPELLRRGIPAVLFVPAGCLGTGPAWLAGSAHSDAGEEVLSADELRMLPRELVRVGSHSLDHVRLPTLSDEDLRRQLRESRLRLEHAVGGPVTLLSPPHGACDARVINLAREAGYTRVFTIKPELVRPANGRIDCGRCLVRPTDWRLEFRLKVLGAYSWLPVAGGIHGRLASALGIRSDHAERTQGAGSWPGLSGAMRNLR